MQQQVQTKQERKNLSLCCADATADESLVVDKPAGELAQLVLSKCAESGEAVPCTVQTLGVDVDPPCYTNIDYPWTAPPGLCFLPPRVPVPWRGQLARTA